VSQPDVVQPGLFAEPAHRVAAPVVRVVLLCGASGSGKTSLTRRLGLPVLQLDDFYRDADDPADPPLPRRFGIVDWDDPASWDADEAIACLVRLGREGCAEVPVYDIPTSRRTGRAKLDVSGCPLLVAEGIFAARLVGRTRDAGLLADAICLRLPGHVTFWRRLARDLGEARKPPLTLVRRGVALLLQEPALVEQWTALGCRPMSPLEAERAIRALLPRDHARRA
jgi:uridine kinase